MMKTLRLIILCCMQLFVVHATDKDVSIHNDWTWMYCKKFTSRNRTLNTHKKEFLFTQEGVAPFTQLLFSWNILRPTKGHFSFYVQVRDAETKQWGE